MICGEKKKIGRESNVIGLVGVIISIYRDGVFPEVSTHHQFYRGVVGPVLPDHGALPMAQRTRHGVQKTQRTQGAARSQTLGLQLKKDGQNS